jgi:chromosome partitioning protein
MSDPKPEETEPPMSNIAHPDFHPRRHTPWGTLEGRVISMVSRKGGVGKTTSAVNLGAALALSGHTVLVIGTDPQCGVCRTLGVQPHELATCLSDVLTGTHALNDLVHPSALQDLFFISPRILTLDQEEAYLQGMEQNADTLLHEIDRARNLYDTIIIDCPPGLGSPTRAALLASDSYLVPVQAEELCRDSVDSLLEFVDSFREKTFPNPAGLDSDLTDQENQPLALEGIFLTMASTHTRMGRHVATRVSEDFGDVLFTSSVPRTTRLSEMALRGKPAVIYDRRSPGSRAYFNLADELVQRYQLAEESMGLAPETSLPERIDPFGPDGEDEGKEQILEPAAADGLEKFLAALGGVKREATAAGFSEDSGGPEIVSLDDLLAEEENRGDNTDQSDEDWNGGFWNRDPDDGKRFN